MARTRARVAAALRDTFAQLRDTEPALLDTHVDATSGRHGVTLRWVAGPSEDTVDALASDVAATIDPAATVPIHHDRVALWACGAVHADADDAFYAHEGADLLVQDDVGGYCDLCGPVPEQVVDRDALSAWIAAGNSTDSSCQPVPALAACPACDRGTVTDPATLAVRDCGTCDGRGHVDLTDPVQAAAAVAATAATLASR